MARRIGAIDRGGFECRMQLKRQEREKQAIAGHTAARPLHFKVAPADRGNQQPDDRARAKIGHGLRDDRSKRELVDAHKRQSRLTDRILGIKRKGLKPADDRQARYGGRRMLR